MTSGRKQRRTFTGVDTVATGSPTSPWATGGEVKRQLFPSFDWLTIARFRAQMDLEVGGDPRRGSGALVVVGLNPMLDPHPIRFFLF